MMLIDSPEMRMGCDYSLEYACTAKTQYFNYTKHTLQLKREIRKRDRKCYLRRDRKNKSLFVLSQLSKGSFRRTYKSLYFQILWLYFDDILFQ